MRERNPRESLYARSKDEALRSLDAPDTGDLQPVLRPRDASRLVGLSAVKGAKVVWICVASVVVAELEKRPRLAFQARRPSNRKATPGDHPGEDLP